ncbi:MAG: hypothetical protein HKP28_04485 [Winogradskyella sp.]|nr:hypothetical protein [Winogradskyella sp.]
MRTLQRILLCMCVVTSWSYAQQKLKKTSQSIKVNKDVIVDLNTSYVEIELDTWNRDVVEVEGFIESDKLTEAQLKEVLAAWDLKIEGTLESVKISSTGSRLHGVIADGDYSGHLKELEMHLAEIPHMPPMPKLAEMPELPPMPEMPPMPALPELPDGIENFNFDYDKYQKEGDAYLKEWSKAYESKGGKELEKRIEEWAKRFEDSNFQKEMEKWGEEFAKRFEGKWAKEMEKWGEEFGEKYAKDMENWGDNFGDKLGEEWARKMEAWGERFGKEFEERAKLLEERNKTRTEHFIERKKALNDRERALFSRHKDLDKEFKVKKTLKIKIPKKAKLKMNVRHGELKISSVIHNLKGDISHSYFIAEHIDGGDTSINVSYTPLLVNLWNNGTLNLKFVDKAQIKTASYLVLNSNSSNVLIDNLNTTGVIDGSFGDLTISTLSNDFKSLNLVLANSDALINLPTSAFYNLYYKGSNSKFNNIIASQKTIRNYPEGQSTDRNIVINTKFSNIIIN